MRLWESRKAGDVLAHTVYRGCPIVVKKGNDIMRRNPLRMPIRLQTLIVEAEVNGKQVYQCHVVHGRWFSKRITTQAIKDTIAEWKEEIDEILDTNDA